MKVLVSAPEYMLTAEVAEAFGVDAVTVRRWVRLGRLHAGCTPGGSWRFARDEVARLLAAGAS